jgi:hypothetical protein
MGDKHKSKEYLSLKEKELKSLCDQQRQVLNLFKDTVHLKTQYSGMLEDIISSKDDQIDKLKEIIMGYENIINDKLKEIK